MIAFKVNGKPVTFDGDSGTPLLWVLRDHLRLTGTKFSCGLGLCGACVVHVDGRAAAACRLPVRTVAGQVVTTIEGLANEGKLHPLQQNFVDGGAIQCGFCTPGMIMSAKAMLDENPNPTEEEIKRGISGNLCRCTGYTKIIEAVLTATET